MPRFLDSAAAFLASFSPTERAVARQAFQGILAGRPVARGDLARGLGLPADDVDVAVARHVARGTMVLEDDRIVAARGLSIPETPHVIDVDGRRLHAFCAIDAVGIPVALGLEAAVRSRCHRCATRVALTIAGGAVREVPANVIIWAPDRDPERSLRGHTWPLINFFCSVEHAREWEGSAPRDGDVVTLEEVTAAAPGMWGAMA